MFNSNFSKFSEHADTFHVQASELTGEWPLDLILVRHGQSVRKILQIHHIRKEMRR